MDLLLSMTLSCNAQLQSKNGGLAAWEPAGAANWLEVASQRQQKQNSSLSFKFVGVN